MLKDGSDSVGALGALNRVYLNIGTFSEEWLLHFNPLVGGKPITPIPIADARQNSAYFAATEAQTLRHGALLPEDDRRRIAWPTRPAATAYLTNDQRLLTRGKEVVRRELRALPFVQAARRR